LALDRLFRNPSRPLRRQSPAQFIPKVTSVRVEPAELEANIGQDLHFKAVGLDAAGNPVDAPVSLWFAAPWDLGS
jgi:hypothetical protein